MAEKSLLEQMREDVVRALKKPVEERRWAMVIDIRKCIGCHSCTVACKAENKTAPGMEYRWVAEAEDGSYPNVSKYFMPTLCMQCEKPPCVKACREKAIFKRTDGIVEVDYDKCTHCDQPSACPYGVMFKDAGAYYTKNTPKLEAYEMAATFEYGKKQVRKKGASPVGRCRKCHYCLHRLESGMLPACVSTCLGNTNYFGDLNDPKSVVAKMARDPNVYIFRAALGTGPTTRYMTADPKTCAKCHE